MTEELIALSRRAISCKKFRWMPGMRVLWSDGMEDRVTRLIGDAPSAVLLAGNPLIDLADPATLGCLLHLVREAWGDPHSSSRWLQPAWKFLVQRPGYVSYTVVGEGRTEAEALTRALESAP